MNKKRHSVEKAEWSIEREVMYENDCRKITRGITCVDDKVFKDGELLSQGKRKWYEAWLALTYMPTGVWRK